MGRSCLKNVWLSFLVVSSLICIVFNTGMQIPSKKTKKFEFFLFWSRRPRRSQAVSDSDAALRQQIQTNNIASSNPRLVEKIVARGSWFVARKSPPLYQNGLWANLTAGRPLGVPYAQGRWPCIFTCGRVLFHRLLRYRRGRLKGVPP